MEATGNSTGNNGASWGQGRVALVTGAGVRLGRKISLALHRQGYNLVLHCCASLSSTQALADELNASRKESAHVIQENFTTDVAATSKRVIDAAVVKWSRLDLLVNNAACYYQTPLEQATSEQWDAIMNLNAKAPFFLTQAAAEHLRSSEGSVVNIADIQGERPKFEKKHNIYCISKSALIMTTKTLAIELAPKVRVNYVNPGAAMFPENTPEDIKKNWLSKTPLGVEGNGDEIADAVLFLASPSANYITGIGISVCGGRSIHL